jgi:ribulose-phosphate 3-epimerase
VRDVRALLDAAGNDALVEIDGGIDLHNVARVVSAGARMIVAGSAVFNTPDPERAVRELKAAALAAVPPVAVPR